MKGKLKTSSIVAGALLAIQLYAGVATAGQPTSVWGAWTLTANQTLGQTLAALDTGDNPRCGKDGACNLAVCSADEDPDCRDLDLPPGAGADPATTMNRYPSRPSDVMDCTSKETTEIAAAVDWGAEKGIGSINLKKAVGTYCGRLIC